MQINTLTDEIARLANLLGQTVAREFPDQPEIYLNTGSCGRKPASVLRAISKGWEDLNVNPTWTTFVNPEPVAQARAAVAALLQVDESRILLQNNPTQALHLILSNLLEPGDELVTTDKEHGCVNAISRWLLEHRKVVTRRYPIDAFEGSKRLCAGLLDLVTDKTKVVLVSEIGSYTGWRPDLSYLRSTLASTDVELVVDGAHAPGQGLARPDLQRFWVGSGHKWLGGPNGTGFAVLPLHMVPEFEPLLLGDQYYLKKDVNAADITRFESSGTSDIVRWQGLAAACNLYRATGERVIEKAQLSLAQYFRQSVERLTPEFRTPDLFTRNPAEATSMVVCYWPRERLTVPDLRQAIWERHRIWVQPDFANADPGCGIRISCHYANSRLQIDKLLDALDSLVKP